MASNETMVAPLVIGPLSANQPWTSPIRDRLSGEHMVRRVRAEIWAPQAGTLYLDVWDAEDKSDVASTAFVVTVNVTNPTPWTELTKRFYGWRFINGATAQNGIRAFEEKAGRPLADVTVSGSNVTELKLQDAAAAPGNGQELNVTGMATCSFEVTGPFVGTVICEGKTSSGNWYPLNITQVGAGAVSDTGTVTAVGLYVASCATFTTVRARVSAYTSGTITVTGRAIPVDRANKSVALANVEGTPGQAAPAKGAVTGGMYSATPLTLADGQMSRTQMDAKGNTLVGIRGSNGSEPSVLGLAGDLVAANYNGLTVNAVLRATDGLNLSVWRNNTEGTLLASAARTASVQGPTQTNHNARGVLITINVTANPGGAETLTLNLMVHDPVSGNNNTGIAVLATVAASNGVYRLLVYPGASGTPNGTTNKAYALAVPRTWSPYVAHSGSSSWTYSVGFQYIV